MTVKRACVLVSSRASTTVTMLGVASMLGFVGPLGSCALGMTDEPTSLACATIALGAFLVCWAVAHAGVPLDAPPQKARSRRARTELLRAHARRLARSRSRSRQAVQVPRSSWEWPVSTKPKLTATSR